MRKLLSGLALAVALHFGCGGLPPEEASHETQPVPATNAVPLAPQSLEEARQEGSQNGVHSELQSELSRRVGEKLVDPTYNGLIALGSQEGWNFYFDKQSNMVVASRGDSSVAFDPSKLDAPMITSLTVAGIPESVLLTWQGVVCRAACWGAGTLGCTAVSLVCAGASVITVGGFSLPCVYAVPAACLASGAGASVCSDWCTAKFG